jgi:hypothetical protein
MKYYLGLLFAALSLLASAQGFKPDHISLSPVSITGLGGIQSYAFGQLNGEWVIVGGRLDGLHRRQPFAAFDLAGHNTTIWVVNPTNNQLWTAPLAALPANLREPLSATNPEFYQEDSTLLIIGGYGYSPSLGDHTTFPTLTVLDLPALITAVKEGTSLLPAIRQVTDDNFAVTGGHLAKVYDTWNLVGGQRFEGRYNPMGPDHGPGFTQVYTDQVRRFRLRHEGDSMAIEHLPAWTDEAHLHRRDYNVVPQIMPNGEEGLTAFSGVFRRDANLPFLQPVDIDSSGYAVNFDFLQYYNHYHCPTIPLFAESTGEMHTLFFGGMAQFYPGSNGRVQDDNVPFVKTITRVSRMASGEMEEVPLAQQLPTFLGAGAEFIPREDLPTFPNGVIRMDALNVAPGDSLLLGYIFGGIRSSAENIFFVNDGTQSEAHNRAYAVYLHNSATTAVEEPGGPPIADFRVYPNPNRGSFRITFSTRVPRQNVQLLAYDLRGRRVASKTFESLSVGEHQFEWQHEEKLPRGSYLLQLTQGTQVLVSGKLIVRN